MPANGIFVQEAERPPEQAPTETVATPSRLVAVLAFAAFAAAVVGLLLRGGWTAAGFVVAVALIAAAYLLQGRTQWMSVGRDT